VIPSRSREDELFAAGHRVIIAMDEVGRGALAGPVSVSAAIFTEDLAQGPDGIKDSKLVSEKNRGPLAEAIRAWLPAVSVGESSPQEIDSVGITKALGRAGARALGQLSAWLDPSRFPVVLLDGHHDWLSAHLDYSLRVITQVKADRDCLSVAASSLVAKVTRDRVMVEADPRFPHYGFASNKGYGSSGHMAAIEQYGPCELHRMTWLRPTELAIDER
jgi:ribonuclease HII